MSELVSTTVRNKQDALDALSKNISADEKKLLIILWSLAGYMEEIVLVNLIDMLSVEVLFNQSLIYLLNTQQITDEDCVFILNNIKNTMTLPIMGRQMSLN